MPIARLKGCPAIAVTSLHLIVILHWYHCLCLDFTKSAKSLRPVNTETLDVDMDSYLVYVAISSSNEIKFSCWFLLRQSQMIIYTT